MESLSNLLKPQDLHKLISTQLTKGSVFRMRLSAEEGIKDKNPGDNGRNKYFIVLGVSDTGCVIGFVLINSCINENLPGSIKNLHYPLSSSNYSFLSNNSFVDCSRIKEIQKDKFTALFNLNSIKGVITQEDLKLIIEAVKSSGLVTPKQLRKFGLL